MAKPNVLVMTGYGINCEEETAFAFQKAGGRPSIVHVNDLIDGHAALREYQVFALPGGFSFGDDTGSGNALANRIRNHLWHELREFVEGDGLVLGVCNGFQVMVNLGLVPALDRNYGVREAALAHNDSARYNCRWVDLQTVGKGPWLEGLESLSLPVAHGEGKFFAPSPILAALWQNCQVAFRYCSGRMQEYQDLPPNPNGALEEIAGITDPSGRILGMMPHPERAIDFTQRPDWLLLKEQLRREGLPLPDEGPGLQIFRNGVGYFK